MIDTNRPRYPDGAVVMDEHVTAEHVAELAAEVERLRADLEQLRAALGIRSEPTAQMRRTLIDEVDADLWRNGVDGQIEAGKVRRQEQ